jgi:hypothetical protein
MQLDSLTDDLDTQAISKLEDREDGSSVYQVGVPKKEVIRDDSFSRNLALDMDDVTLNNISEYMIECLEEDIKAREPWLQMHKEAEKFLGNSLEDKGKVASPQLNRAFDTTFSNGVIRFAANAASELLPDGGPCSFKIVGEDRTDLDYIAKIRTAWMNYYLTTVDEGYYYDSRRLYYYVGYYGTIIRKTYFDDILKRPISRFILPENFLINTDCTAVLESDRLTHILKLSARDILIKQRDEIYREAKLPYLKSAKNAEEINVDKSADIKTDTANSSVYTNRTLHDVYESHVYLCLDSFKQNYDNDSSPSIPKPYIISIDKESKEILSIKQSWQKNDPNFNRRKYFTGYNYFTGQDIWGMGLARMCGTNAMTATSTLRQIIDAGTYQNMPAYLMRKGASKQQETNMTLGPGDVKIVDCAGDLSSMMIPIPATGPSSSLIEIRRDIIAQMQDQLSSSEMGMMDSKEDIPTGTAVAFMEQANKIQSAVMKSLHDSFSQELKLIDDIFKETLDRQEFFFNGAQHIITKEHFVDSIQIVPVSDPSSNSAIQRIMKAEAVFQAGMQLPDKVNTVQLLKMIFKAQGLSEEVIESILTLQQEEPVRPRNPITENMDLMQNKPAEAGIDQNHDAHIIVHSAIDNDVARAHIQQHVAMKFLVQMQRQMGINLAELGDLENNQELQNIIAIKAAQAVEELGLNKQDDEANEGNIDQQLLAADIEQKSEANKIRKEIADMKLEGEVFKSQLKFEEAKEKMKIQKEQATNNIQLELEKIKQRIGV